MALVKAVKSFISFHFISVVTKLIGDTLTHINLTECLIRPAAQIYFGGYPVRTQL